MGPEKFPLLPPPPALSEAARKRLSALAVRAIQAHVLGLPEEDDETEAAGQPEPSSLADGNARQGDALEELQQRVGVFVTLLAEGDLRGCLGMAEGREPLLVAVPRLARAAASRDLRFAPLAREELPLLSVEITLLGALTRLPAARQILLAGLDPQVCGVYLHLGGRSGLLLPQVARRLQWDALELLRQVSLKAGLPAMAWQEARAEIHGFTAFSFVAAVEGEVTLPPQAPAGGGSPLGSPGSDSGGA
jgi:AmmeMemoRadiSam system protein A